MSTLLVLPILVPMATAAAAIPFAGQRTTQRAIGVSGMAIQCVVAAVLLYQVWDGEIYATTLGGWPAPYGITLVADVLAAVMVALAAGTGLAVAVFSIGTIDDEEERLSYYPIVLFLIAGVSGAFLTGDMFNLYVWFEVLLIASFVLLALEGRVSQTSAAITYVVLNLIASVMFLSGLGLLYGLAGTMNMADLSLVIAGSSEGELITAVAMLFLVAFAIKAAMFPLFFWLPTSYPTAPTAVAALFAGLLTKVGVYALIRVFTLVFTQDTGYIGAIILAAAGVTMITGVLGAVFLTDMRRILSFHIISQIGYMTMGLGLGTPLALAGSVFYITHHIIVKANLFLIAGLIMRATGSYHLERIGGLYRSLPVLGIIFLVPALSLAGIPPLSGFFAKFMLVRAGIDEESYLIVGVALGVGLLTLYSMTKIWAEAFWKPHPEPARIPQEGVALHLFAPVVALAACTLVLGFWAEPFVGLANEASLQLTDPSVYIESVLGSPSP